MPGREEKPLLPERSSQETRRRNLSGAALTALAVWFVFAPVLRNGFAEPWDRAVIAGNPIITSRGSGWLRAALTGSVRETWAPGFWIALRVQHALWGDNPAGYHAVSVAAHAIAAAVAFLLCRRLGSSTFAAGLGTLAWAVHPMRLEPVAKIAAQSFTLGGAAAVAGSLLVMRAMHPERPPSGAVIGRLRNLEGGWAYAAGLVLCAVAFSIQPLYALWPMAILALDILWPPPPDPFLEWEAPRLTFTHIVNRFERVFWRLLPVCVIGIAAGGAMFIAQRSFGLVSARRAHEIAANALVASHNLMFYVGKTLLPSHLSAIYELPEPITIRNTHYAVGVGFGAVLVVVCLASMARLPRLSAGLWAFILGVLPALQFVPLRIPISDSYTYLGGLGLCWSAAAGLERAAVFLKNRIGAFGMGITHAISVLALVLLALASLLRAPQWRDGRSVLTAAVAVSPSSGLARAALASLLLDEGALDEAGRVIESGLRAAGRCAELAVVQGRYLFARGEIDAALEAAARAVSLDPANPEAQHLRILASLKKGDRDGAANALENLLGFARPAPWLLAEAGAALLENGMKEHAVECFKRALDSQPLDASAWNLYAVAAARMGREGLAFRALEKADALRPNDYDITLNMGNLHLRAAEIFQRSGDGAAAERCRQAAKRRFQKAEQLRSPAGGQGGAAAHYAPEQ